MSLVPDVPVIHILPMIRVYQKTSFFLIFFKVSKKLHWGLKMLCVKYLVDWGILEGGSPLIQILYRIQWGKISKFPKIPLEA